MSTLHFSVLVPQFPWISAVYNALVDPTDAPIALSALFGFVLPQNAVRLRASLRVLAQTERPLEFLSSLSGAIPLQVELSEALRRDQLRVLVSLLVSFIWYCHLVDNDVSGS